LLAQSRWAGADLRAMVMEELSPYFENGDVRAEVDGPKLMLDPDPAQAMAMAIHELTTNAVKYGALTVPTGRVKVEWRPRPGNRLNLRWTETGGPRVTVPTHQGFGSRVMQRMICGQCNGTLDFDWREEGVICDITVVT
jgi:two-component sensor histidine kinase